MKLAFSPSTPGVGSAELVELAQLAEGLGYEEAWLAEVAGPETFALAGAMAAATERMALGVAVVPAYTRTPVVLAMGAATVSRMARGRPFRLGIGSSSQIIVEEWHGQAFARPLVRVRETVTATRALLAGERDFEGVTVRAARFRAAEPPAGSVDLYVGALGPGMLRVAGAVGDGVCLNLMPPEVVPRQVAEVAAGATAAGRTLDDDFGFMARLHVVLTDDVAAGRDAIRQGFGPYFAQPVYNRFLAWCGFPAEAEAIAAAFRTGDRAAVAAAMHDDLVDAVALVGPPASIRERLEQYAAGGITIAALNFLTPGAEAAAAALRALAPG